MKERELREAESRAQQQTHITKSELSMLVQAKTGKAELPGAEAERAARVGVAQAMAIEEQVRAYGGPRFQLTQQVMNRFAEAIQASGVDVVPLVVVGGSGGGHGDGGPATGNVMEGLLTLLLSERLGGELGTPMGARSAEAEAMRKRIHDGLEGGKPQ